MFRLSIAAVTVAALVGVMAPEPLGAITNDKLAYLTFSAPVQIPGVTLNAGTYRFRLTNPDTSRNVIQVLSHDGAVVYSMFHTIPDSRIDLTDDPFVTFRETPVGVPPAVRSLFYGGEYHGYEFVYFGDGPNMIPEVWPQPEVRFVPYTAAAPAAMEPLTEADAEPMFEPVVEQAAEPAVQPAPAELPRTASPLPFVAAGGLASILAGLGLGRLRRKAR